MRRIAVLGTGLIGGSIGLGLRRRRGGTTVSGFDRDPAVARRALERGALSGIAPSAAAAVADADLVVLAVPLGEFAATTTAIAPAVPPDAVVTDVGSAKAEVVATGESTFGPRFVGGHPMAGSERHGIDAADPELFRDSCWILTPTATTASGAYGRAADLAGSLGSRVVAVDPEEHDALVARLSHIPQLLASAIVRLATEGGDRDALLGLAGGGFRDVTRIAASDPDMWVSILRANRAAVLTWLDALGGTLNDAAALIATERWEDLRAWLRSARDARAHLFTRPDHSDEPIALALMVPDRPGVLAEVTTQAGRLGANIEDLRIVHSTEGGRGRLELIITGAAAARALGAALERLGYHVERPDINFSI